MNLSFTNLRLNGIEIENNIVSGYIFFDVLLLRNKKKWTFDQQLEILGS